MRVGAAAFASWGVNSRTGGDMTTYFRSIAEVAAVLRREAVQGRPVGARRSCSSGAELFSSRGSRSNGTRARRGADKFYFVLSGKARMTVGEETRIAGAGRWSGRQPMYRTASTRRWSGR